MKKVAAWTLVGLTGLLAACGSQKAAPTGSSHSSTSAAASQNGGSASGSQSALSIPVMLPLTGQASFLGKKEKQSLAILEKDVNQQGGVNGHPVHFNFLDSQSSPKVAVQEMATVAKSPVVIGPSLTATCNAVDATITNQMVNYCLSPVPHPKAGSYVFSAMESAPDFVQADLNYLESHNLHKIAILYSNDASGHAITGITQGLLKTAPYQNIQVTTTQSYDLSAVSVNAQVSRIAATHPQALFIWATGAPIEVAFRGVSQSSLTNIPVFVDDGNMTNDEMQQYAAFLPKSLFFGSGGWDAYSVLPSGPQKTAQAAFVKGFQGLGVKPDIGNAQAWDPARLVLGAFKKYGLNATAQQIHQYIESQKQFVGIFGTYDFTTGNQRGLTLHDVYVYQWNPSKHVWDVVSGREGKGKP